MTAHDIADEGCNAWYNQPVQRITAGERRRKIPLQVLNLGMMRTGTMCREPSFAAQAVKLELTFPKQYKRP